MMLEAVTQLSGPWNRLHNFICISYLIFNKYEALHQLFNIASVLDRVCFSFVLFFSVCYMAQDAVV